MLEREIIKKIFRSDMDGFSKILLKELAIETGHFSDKAEDVADRLTIISVKRLI